MLVITSQVEALKHQIENNAYQMNSGSVPGVEKCVIKSFSVAIPRKLNNNYAYF